MSSSVFFRTRQAEFALEVVQETQIEVSLYSPGGQSISTWLSEEQAIEIAVVLLRNLSTDAVDQIMKEVNG